LRTLSFNRLRVIDCRMRSAETNGIA
jgi:hypothetical protein